MESTDWKGKAVTRSKVNKRLKKLVIGYHAKRGKYFKDVSTCLSGQGTSTCMETSLGIISDNHVTKKSILSHPFRLISVYSVC